MHAHSKKTRHRNQNMVPVPVPSLKKKGWSWWGADNTTIKRICDKSNAHSTFYTSGRRVDPMILDIEINRHK